MDATLVAHFIVIGFTFFMLLNSAAVLVYMERKVAAVIQQRYGPYLVGPKGALQPLADIIKLIFKEELRPKSAVEAVAYFMVAEALTNVAKHSRASQAKVVVEGHGYPGTLTAKVSVTAHKFSASARDKIAAAGGSVTEL